MQQLGRNRFVMVIAALAAAGVVLAGVALWRVSSMLVIAYVRTGDLVYRYAGMREAQDRYRVQQAVWRHEIDSLEEEFRAKIGPDQRATVRLSEEERRELVLARRGLEERRRSLEAKAAEEERALTEGVLKQINSFVAGYGKRHGYDVIVGATGDGGVLYGNSALDVTEDLLKELNESHGGAAHAQ